MDANDFEWKVVPPDTFVQFCRNKKIGPADTKKLGVEFKVPDPVVAIRTETLIQFTDGTAVAVTPRLSGMYWIFCRKPKMKWEPCTPAQALAFAVSKDVVSGSVGRKVVFTDGTAIHCTQSGRWRIRRLPR